VGPRALEVAHPAYNAAVRRVENDELLLNLVRLRYLDPIKFLKVGTVSAQFSVSLDAEVEVARGGGRTDVTGTGGLGWREAPTLTFVPRDDNDFARLLTSPVDVGTLASLSRGESGWKWSLALCALTLNGAWISPESGGGEGFWARERALAGLTTDGHAALGYVLDPVPVSGPIERSQLKPGDLIQAADKGYRFEDAGDGQHVVLTAPRKRPALRILPGRGGAAAAALSTLGLRPGLETYPLRPADELGKVVEDSDALYLGTRSVLGILGVLAEGVQVPPDHLAAGLAPPLVSRTYIEGGGRVADVFRVRSSPSRPCARLAVEHRGRWFYIDDADTTSRRVFLLLALFYDLELAARRGAGEGPVLTLPVG
jgi:hypothetical protein